MTKLEQIIDLAKSTGDQQRRQKQADKFSTYLDDFEDKVIAKIKKQFHEDNYERLYKMVAVYYNLLKKVINAKALLYKKEASRKWLKRDGKTIDDKYDDFVNGTNLNTASQTINKYANINNISFMRLKPNYEKQVIDYEAIPAENIVVLRDEDDPFLILAVLHKIVTTHTFWLYTDTEITCKLTEDFGEIYGQQDNLFKDPNKSNIGIIPYIPVWAAPTMANDFWNYTGNDDLYNVTIQLNVHLTHFNNVLKVGCYKQLAFTGLQTDDIKRLYGHVTDGLNPIAVTGEHAKIDALLMAEKFGEYIDAIDAIAARVLDQYGFDFEVQSKSGQKASGLSIKLRKDALDDLKEEQQPLFRDYEKRVAYVTVVMANQAFNTGIDLNGLFQIDFWEEPASITPEDTVVMDWHLMRGIKSIKDIFKKFNPDVPDDEIEQKIKDNLAEYNSIFGAGEADKEIEGAFAEAQAGTEKPEEKVIG